MRSKSSIPIGVQFSQELIAEMRKLAASSPKGVNWHIRQACIVYLAANGVDTTNLDNPERRGVRTDLKKLNKQETSLLIEQLKKTRKVKKK